MATELSGVLTGPPDLGAAKVAWTGGDGGPATAQAGAGSPSLSMSHNSTEPPSFSPSQIPEPLVNKLTGSQKRMAFVLAEEVKNLAKVYGIERVGFLTLTFGKKVVSMTEAQRRFNSLNTHVLNGRYSRAICVWERHKSGGLHCHLVVVLPEDIRSGFDFGAFQAACAEYARDKKSAEGKRLTRVYAASASDYLRGEWAFWRKTGPRYRFGKRIELLPVKTTAEGIAHYVGGYIKKGLEGKLAEDRGRRVVRFSGYGVGDRRATASFGWNTDNAWLWRQKLKLLAESTGATSTDDLARMFGARWAYLLQKEILAVHVPECRSRKCAVVQFEREGRAWMEREGADRERERRLGPARTYTLRPAASVVYVPAALPPAPVEVPSACSSESHQPLQMTLPGLQTSIRRQN